MPTTSAPTGATHGQIIPANIPKSAYIIRPGKCEPANIQRRNAANPAMRVPRAATLILPTRSLASPMSGLPMPWDTTGRELAEEHRLSFFWNLGLTVEHGCCKRTLACREPNLAGIIGDREDDNDIAHEPKETPAKE